MKKIGALSDTHGHIDDKTLEFLAEADEIWHAGDIGNTAITEKLGELAPVRAVYGNIDGQDLRSIWPGFQSFELEDVAILITHIGGKPGKYTREAASLIRKSSPGLFLCGHSHILKIQYDRQYNMLFVNPGAAGKTGFHRVKTALRFQLDGGEITNMEVHEIDPRANQPNKSFNQYKNKHS
jgi:hypothetical protein